MLNADVSLFAELLLGSHLSIAKLSLRQCVDQCNRVGVISAQSAVSG